MMAAAFRMDLNEAKSSGTKWTSVEGLMDIIFFDDWCDFGLGAAQEENFVWLSLGKVNCCLSSKATFCRSSDKAVIGASICSRTD